MNRIGRKFKQLKKANKKALIVFITAGFPSLTITEKLIYELERCGADIIELGVPFSDPLADGPVIEEASQRALGRGVTLVRILNLVKKIRATSRIPICLMTYYNPIFCFGEERFVKQAVNSGVDGVIIPDLPVEEARGLITLASRWGLATIFFISPTTPRERVKIISRNSSGFIYYISLTGVTGPRKKLPPDLLNNLKHIKASVNKPLCVGFGISSRQQVKEIYRFADGAIVGSAVVKKIKDNIAKPKLVENVGKFVRGLKV